MSKASKVSLFRSISDRKFADITALSNEVKLAQYDVSEKQSIVTSLTAKSQQFQAYLSEAQGARATTLANRNLALQAASSAHSLDKAVGQAVTETKTAFDTSKTVSESMSDLVNSLIYTVDVIDKLAQFVNKQKAMNPLIPDSLVASLGKATTDASDAVSLTLVALQSSFAADAVLNEAHLAVKLGQRQSNFLAMLLAGSEASTPASGKSSIMVEAGQPLVKMLENIFAQAQAHYDAALKDSEIVTQQLEFAQAQLAEAQTNLASSQAGLAAANAAAYAA